MDLNEYISLQDIIIVIILVIFCDLLDLLLSEDSCKEREFRTERYGKVIHRGKCKHITFRIKSDLQFNKQ